MNWIVFALSASTALWCALVAAHCLRRDRLHACVACCFLSGVNVMFAIRFGARLVLEVLR